MHLHIIFFLVQDRSVARLEMGYIKVAENCDEMENGTPLQTVSV